MFSRGSRGGFDPPDFTEHTGVFQTFVLPPTTIGFIPGWNQQHGCAWPALLPKASSISLQWHCTTSQSMMLGLFDAGLLITY